MKNAKVEEIKKMYPAPMIAKGAMDRETKVKRRYCVGGALCMFNGGVHRFPIEDKIVEVLMKENDNLDNDTASDFASEIIGNNDAGLFDMAWIELENALNYGMEVNNDK